MGKGIKRKKFEAKSGRDSEARQDLETRVRTE